MEGYQSGLGYVSVGEERLREYGGVFSPQAAGEDDMCLLQEAAGLYRGREELRKLYYKWASDSNQTNVFLLWAHDMT